MLFERGQDFVSAAGAFINTISFGAALGLYLLDLLLKFRLHVIVMYTLCIHDSLDVGFVFFARTFCLHS